MHTLCAGLTSAWSRGLAGWRRMLHMRHIFHLSIPVSDLAAALDFYQRAFDGRIGRVEHDWVDILVWGHQITLQHRPDEVLPTGAQGKRHFGVVLPWSEWVTAVTRLQALGIEFLEPPAVLRESTPEEQAKLFVQDPSYNVIELKAYRNVAQVLGIDDEGYRDGDG